MSRSKALAGLAIVAAGVPAPALAAAAQDLRSPDARDAAAEAHSVAPQDLRSPDARDAAADRPTVVLTSTPAPSVSDGFEWGDAGIGAATMLALVTLAGGTLLLTARGRRRARLS